MTILLVDIGNTRVKWALLRGSRLSRMQALAHERQAWGMHRVVRAVMRAAPGGVTRVVAVCVGGPVLERALAGAARARLRVDTEFVRSARAAAGVRNGYRETWRLGADRWVGVIGAHHLAKDRPALVANVGTALTLDAVSPKGRHLGGAIVPGPATMVESLLAGTHGIRRRARGLRANDRSLFARETASALAAGARFAAAAFIDRAVIEATQRLKTRPLLLLSGGGAAAIRRALKTPAREIPDLVLHGLAVCAKEP
jgi:type III pantothenate kinase